MKRVALDEPLSSTKMRELRDHWLAARDDRVMPARSDLDPQIVPHLLPHMVLTDVSHEPRRYRYRLIGTFVTEMAGRDATGRWLDQDLYGDNTDDMLWAFHTCVDSRAPVAVREAVQFAAKEWIVIEALLLPMGISDAEVDMVLSGVDLVEGQNAQLPAGTSYQLNWRLSLD